MKYFASICLTIILLNGCYHPIMIKPSYVHVPNKFRLGYKYKVAYVISQEELRKEFVTFVGMNGKVGYKPYEALGYALEYALKKVFLDATRIDSISSIEKYPDITLVFDPNIKKTNASTTSFIRWIPEKFTIQLECFVYDRQSTVVQKVDTIGHGSSTRDDWGRKPIQYGIAGRRAMQDAIEKIFYQLNYDELSNYGSPKKETKKTHLKY